MIKRTAFKAAMLLFLSYAFLSPWHAGPAVAAQSKPLAKDEAKEVLSALAPDVNILTVEMAAVEGLWEVVFESGGKKGIVYVDDSRRFIVLGSIVDLTTRENLTQSKFEAMNVVDFSTIPLSDALVLGNTKAKYKVVVFDDPD